MKIGIAGAGFWTLFQISGWLEIPGIEIVAIANKTKERAAAIAEEFGIPAVYQGIPEMLDGSEIECLDVITSVEGHYSAVMQAAERSVPVICQKPMSTSLENARRMVQTCQKHNVPFLVNENWRYQAPIRAVFEELSRGTIGEPFRARIQFSCSFPVLENQPAMKELPQFILTDIGSHILDVARFLFGEASDLVCKTSRIAQDIKGEDVATVLMTMERCPVVTCEMSYASLLKDEAFPETYITIEGSQGSIELVKGRKLFVTTRSGAREREIIPKRYSWADPAYDLVHASIVDCNRALAEALITGGKAETSGEDNLRTVELVFASYDSSVRNEKVDFAGGEYDS